MEKNMIPPELEAMLNEIKTPVIFATGNIYPHATPMNWLWLRNEGLFWFNPAGGTKKLVNMKRNRRVCFATFDGMKKDGRGFIVWGEITRFEEGLIGLIKNLLIKIRMLLEKSEINFFTSKIYRFWRVYAKHPDIYYSTLPWVAAFVRVKPRKIKFWLDDQKEKEIVF